MRRSLLAGIGALAVLIVAACSPDQPSEPLAPADVGLAKGGGGDSQLCANSVLSDIGKLQSALFTKAQVAQVLNPLLTVIKNECPTTAPSVALMTYIQKVIDFRPAIASPPPDVTAGTPAPEITEQRASDLVTLWNLVTTYATTAPALERLPSVMMTGQLITGQAGSRGGGADVLEGTDLEMTTFDRQAGVKISDPQSSIPANSSGMYLITMEPSLTGCPGTTLRPATTAQGARPCYELKSYPEVERWSPSVTVGMCIEKANNRAAITHGNPSFGTEVLPTYTSTASFPWGSAYSCTQTHTMLDTWLGRDAGPLGRALARAIDYLRPQPLLADDAGESGLGLFFSPFGGALTDVFGETFPTLGAWTTGERAASPGTWSVLVNHPASVEVKASLADLTGNVLVISQALGNCDICPEVRVIGTRINALATDNIGRYEIHWTSVQTKSSAKNAPFVVRTFEGAEIARLSYVTTSPTSQNLLIYNSDTVGTWTRNVSQRFRITVNLQTLDGINENTTTLAIWDPLATPPQYVNVTQPASFAPAADLKTVSSFGYVLGGIDAGVIGVKDVRMTRISDTPPNQ